MLQNARPLLRVDTALVAIVLALVASAGYLYLERDAARDTLFDVEGQILTLEDDVMALNQELVLKELELAQKLTDLEGAQAQRRERERLESANFPSRAQAGDLNTQVFSYAADNSLGISYFETSEGVGTFGQAEYPAILYTIVARGTPDALVGVLDIVQGVATARVESLDFARDQDEPGQWTMTLDLSVIYAGKV